MGRIQINAFKFISSGVVLTCKRDSQSLNLYGVNAIETFQPFTSQSDGNCTTLTPSDQDERKVIKIYDAQVTVQDKRVTFQSVASRVELHPEFFSATSTYATRVVSDYCVWVSQ